MFDRSVSHLKKNQKEQERRIRGSVGKELQGLLHDVFEEAIPQQLGMRCTSQLHLVPSGWMLCTEPPVLHFPS